MPADTCREAMEATRGTEFLCKLILCIACTRLITPNTGESCDEIAVRQEHQMILMNDEGIQSGDGFLA